MSPVFAMIIPLVGMLAFFGLLFGFLAYIRYLRYKETLALAERGLLRPLRAAAEGRETLRWGIVLAALGLALCIGLYPIGWTGVGELYLLRLGPWMLIGLLPLFFGLALVLVYYLTRDEPVSSRARTDMDASERADR